MTSLPWTLVDEPRSCERAREEIGRASIIGVDTEYDSFRYFREKLCLLQVSTDAMVYLFDPLGSEDFSFLGLLFEDPKILKILHAGDNDMRFLHRDYGFVFNTIFDTHRAAALLGSTALSLPGVLQDYLGLDVKKEKKIQRSRWDIRPLQEKQLAYAAGDAACLIPLYRVLEAGLREWGLEGAASEAFREIAAGRWREKALSPRGHERIKGFEGLDEAGRERLKGLYRWRFEWARRTNRARFMILSDQDLVKLAERGPRSLETLAASDLLSKHQLKELGEELVRVLASVDGD